MKQYILLIGMTLTLFGCSISTPQSQSDLGYATCGTVKEYNAPNFRLLRSECLKQGEKPPEHWEYLRRIATNGSEGTVSKEYFDQHYKFSHVDYRNPNNQETKYIVYYFTINDTQGKEHKEGFSMAVLGGGFASKGVLGLVNKEIDQIIPESKARALVSQSSCFKKQDANIDALEFKMAGGLITSPGEARNETGYVWYWHGPEWGCEVDVETGQVRTHGYMMAL